MAVARELLAPPARREPLRARGRSRGSARHQTGRSSGVIHAGIYYEPGSLKARLCVEGARALYAYCDEHGIPYHKSGKLVVAVDEAELARPRRARTARDRQRGAAACGGCAADEIAEIEPHARGVAALHSPAHRGRRLRRRRRVLRRATSRRPAAASTSAPPSPAPARGDGRPRDRALAPARPSARAGGLLRRPLVGPARGRLRRPRRPADRPLPRRLPEAARRPQAELVRANVYPVPDPDLPFLGAHLTRTFAGDVLIGPSALMAPARDAYEPAHGAPPATSAKRCAWPGTWRMMAHHWRAGLHRDAPRRQPQLLRRRGGADGAGAGRGQGRSRARPGSAPRRSAATASWSTTSSSTAPSARSTSATPPPPPPPPRWRWRG